MAKIVTEVEENVHTLRDIIKQMEPSIRGIFWEAPQHHHVEKGNDWFLALAVIVVACVITAILLDNVMFALLLGLAGGVLGMSAAQRPSIVPYGVSVRGIKVEDELFPYATLAAYHLDEEDPRGPQLLVRTHRKSIPLLVLPVPPEHIDDIEAILEQRLPEEVIHEPLFLKILELFGF